MALDTKREKNLYEYLKNKLGTVLEKPITAEEEQHSFSSMGLDSVTVVILSNEIENELGIALSPTIFWEYENLAELTSFIAQNEASACEKYFQNHKYPNP